MPEAPRPENELGRLTALYALDILDTGPTEAIERITRLAQRIFHATEANVTFIDADREYVLSGSGEPCSLPRSNSFCGWAILDSEVTVVPDLTQDDRFFDNPYLSEEDTRFYAGAPILLFGQRVGTICIYDDVPRELGEDDVDILKDLAASVEHEFESARLAAVDELTGLYNRRGFERAAEHLLKLAERQEVPVTLFAFDLDDLKAINDRQGHATGDLLIKAGADLLMETFRASDMIARVGGDEFAALAFGCLDPDKIVGRLLEAPPADADDLTPRFSTGWVTREPEERTPLVELLAGADQRMYAHKRSRKE